MFPTIKGCRGKPGEQGLVLTSYRDREVKEQQNEIGVGGSLKCSFNAERFDKTEAVANTGSVHQAHRYTRQRGLLGNKVARCSRNVLTIAPVLLEQAVEEAALANVRTPYDSEREAGEHQAARPEGVEQPPRLLFDGMQTPQNFLRRRDSNIVFGEIDSGFEKRNQFKKLLLHRPDAAGHRTAYLLSRNARLVDGGCINQLANSFGLRKIDASV